MPVIEKREVLDKTCHFCYTLKVKAIIKRLFSQGLLPMTVNWAIKLKTSFGNIWSLWALCLIFNIITFFFIYFKIHPGNKILALRYNVIVGVEWYGEGKNLYFIPAIGLAILMVNFILFRAFKGNRDFLAPLAVFVSLCVEIILLASVMFLARVN